MSPSKSGSNGGENNSSGSNASHTTSFYISSIPRRNNPTKLLIFNVHGTLLDTSLQTQPNPNPHIRVTKKTMTRRFVFRPWLIKFLGRCFKISKVAFWRIKGSEYMQEVLCEILLVLSIWKIKSQYIRGQQMIVRSYRKMTRLHCVENL